MTTSPSRAERHPSSGSLLGAGPASAPVVVLSAELRMQLRIHRRCASEHASLVRAMCMHDRSVLPRWHQDDRGRGNDHRGVHVTAKDGAYSTVTAWRSREHWVTYVVPAAIGQHRDILRKHHVSETQLREWAKVKSGYASQSTGRRCIVRPDRLAEVLGVTKRHVQNINRAARELGLEHVALEGRMLDQAEKFRCWQTGSRQRGLATEVALTIPTFLRRVVDTFTPARGPGSTPKTQLPRVSLRGLAAEKKGAAPPPHPHERRHRRRQARTLASEVAQAVPWLAAERPARLAPALMRFATAAQPWTAQDVVDAITTHSILTGRGAIQADTIRTRPAALLASILRGLDEQADHPSMDPFPTVPVTAVPAVPAEPCGAPDCDHGWIEDPDGRVRPCPTCPPSIRGHQDDPWSHVDIDDNGDPPF